MDWETIKRVHAYREQQEKEQRRLRYHAVMIGSALLALDQELFSRTDLTFTEEEKKEARNQMIEMCHNKWKQMNAN